MFARDWLFFMNFKGFMVHALKKFELWRRLLWVSVGLKWKFVLKSNNALKKPCIDGKPKFIIKLKAFYPHFKTWALLLFPIPRFSSII